MISRDAIDELFHGLEVGDEISGQRRRWEFYFCDHRREALEQMQCVLAEVGYESIEIWEPDPANDDKELLFLHFEIVAQLSSEQLVERCAKLDELATNLGVESFDGFEASNVDSGPLEAAR